MAKNLLFLIVFFTGLEYFNLGVSVYRLIVLPLVALTIIAYRRELQLKESTGIYIGILIIKALMGLVNGDEVYSASVFLALPFIIAVATLIYKCGLDSILIGFAWFDVPHMLGWILLEYLDLSFSTTDEFRFSGLHYDSNFMSLYLNIAVYARLTLGLGKGVKRYISIVLILADSYLLLASNSRTGFVVLCALVLFMYYRKYRIYSIISIVVAIGISLRSVLKYIEALPEYLSLASNNYDKVLIRFFKQGDSNLSNRTVFWENIYNITMKSNWYTPIGYANYLEENKHSHNNFLDELLLMGPVLWLTYLIFILVLLKKYTYKRSLTLQPAGIIALITFTYSLTLSFVTYKLWHMSIIILIYAGINRYNHKKPTRVTT